MEPMLLPPTISHLCWVLVSNSTHLLGRLLKTVNRRETAK